MKNINLAFVIIVGAALISGCSLQKMIKLAADQDLQVDPNPLEVHGGKVDFDVSAVLPPKMLPSGMVYTLSTTYEHGDKVVNVGDVEFKADDFPNSSTSTSRKSESFSFDYADGMNPGKLFLSGTAKDPRNGKSEAAPKMEIAPGLITTSLNVKDVYLSSYAEHTYTDEEELIPTNVNFYFEQGKSTLKAGLSTDGESNSKKQKNLAAFIAVKNVTRTVTITGTHSPEGTERINTGLSSDRANAIEKYYRRQMRRYDYKGMADSIKFILKPVVQDWSAFLNALKGYDGVDGPTKAKMSSIVRGTGSFEDKEKSLQKVDGYKKVFKDLYPALRSAQTQILTVKPKKTNAQIAVLAKQIIAGEASADTLKDDEFLFAATLTPSLDEKADIYMAGTKRDGNWVAHNNLAAVYLDMAMNGADNMKQLVQDALTQLEIAANKNANSPEIIANMASAQMMNGEYDKAYETLASAETSSPSNKLKGDINALKGVVEMQRGEYDKAKASFANASGSDEVNFDRGLVSLLTGDYNNANAAFDRVTEKDGQMAAKAYYFKAVTAARSGSAQGVIDNLKESVSRKAAMKDKALNDLEFVNFADAVGQAIR